MYPVTGEYSGFLAKRVALLALVSTCVVVGAAHAVDASPPQDTPSSENGTKLEEITVTARKRTESLQDVPVVVAVISQADIQNNHATDLSSIGELAPQVIIGRDTTGTGAIITIRGISSSSADTGLDQSVSMDIDGVALSRGRIVEAAQFDMQQVQILEGPQALYFGKNSPAGVISIQSADPTDSFGGYVKGGYEFEALEKYGEMAINQPINDTLKMRFAFRYDYMDGWIKNDAPAEANPFQPFAPLPGAGPGNSIGPRGSEISGRLSFLWEPTDDFSAKLKLTLNGERLNSNQPNGDPYCVGGQTVPTILGVPEPHGSCTPNMRVAESNFPSILAVNYDYGNNGVPYERSDLGLASLTLNKTIADFALTSTTGFYDQDRQGTFIGDDSEYVQIYDSEAEHFKQVNEELRLNTAFSGPFNYMAGLYYEHSTRNWFNSPDILNIFNPVADNYSTTTTFADNTTDSYSGFGEVRYKILDPLELAVGARYTHDDKSAVLVNRVGNPAAPALGLALHPDNIPIDAHYDGNNVSPQATLTWKPQADQTLYAAFKEGYKAGGISNQAVLPLAANAANVLFGPEKTNGFEVGYKADLFDRTLRLDVTAYRYNYNGLQVTAYIPSEVRFTIKNAAMARTQGITGSAEWVATDQLSFNYNIGFNHARYLSFPNAQCYDGQSATEGCVGGVQNLSGRALNRAPDVTTRIGADYKVKFVYGSTLNFSVSGAYSTSYSADPTYAPGGMQPAYWLLNSAINLYSADEKYELSLIGRDLTNSFYRVFAYQQSLAAPTQEVGDFNRPREILLEANYKF